MRFEDRRVLLTEARGYGVAIALGLAAGFFEGFE